MTPYLKDLITLKCCNALMVKKKFCDVFCTVVVVSLSLIWMPDRGVSYLKLARHQKTLLALFLAVCQQFVVQVSFSLYYFFAPCSSLFSSITRATTYYIVLLICYLNTMDHCCFYCAKPCQEICNDCQIYAFCSPEHKEYHQVNNTCLPFKVDYIHK